MPQPTSENVYTQESLCETIEEDNWWSCKKSKHIN
jgi:hypothetical protein